VAEGSGFHNGKDVDCNLLDYDAININNFKSTLHHFLYCYLFILFVLLPYSFASNPLVWL
jgi:hypothetical protein